MVRGRKMSMCFRKINLGGYENKYFLSNLFVLRGLARFFGEEEVRKTL